MINFYCLTRADFATKSHCLKALQKASQKLDINFYPLITEKLDLTSFSPSSHDLFYCLTIDPLSRFVERYLISSYSLTTFYRDNTHLTYTPPPLVTFFALKQANLPTVPFLTLNSNHRPYLKKVTQLMGGFPLIIKVPGGSVGVGVIKVDSFSSFTSIIDWFLKHHHNLLIQPYIPHQRNFRLVVVGNKVIAAKANIKISEEFRLNVKDQHKEEAIDPSSNLKRLAIKAVKVLGIETGGVDIIEAQDGQYYLTEVNFPHNFWPTQQVTKIDIAYYMVKHLLSKSSHA